MNLELLILSLLLFSIGVMYINLTSTATECLRKNAINSVNPDLTMMYVNLVIAIILVLMSMIGIYTGIYSTQVTNTIDSNLQFLRT
jgi:uncharacterized membrane protein (DUF485 family)